MKTFRYSFFAKLIYRYGNLPVTLLLLFYLIISLFSIRFDWIYAIPAVVNFVLILLINHLYFKSYSMFPFRIDIYEDKMVCSDFFLSSKVIEIKFDDIDSITGGVFSKKYSRTMVIHDGRNGSSIALYEHLKPTNELLALILSRLPKNRYNQLLEAIRNKGKDRD